MKSLFLRLILILVVILALLQIVKNIRVSNDQPIAAPKNNAIPVSGEWMVERYKLLKSENNKEQVDMWIGKSAYLSEDVAVLGEETCSLPQYKTKTLNAGSFLFNTYNLSAVDLGIESKEIDVISVTSNDKHFYDFMLIDKSNMAVYVDNAILFLRKVSDNIKSSIIAEKVENEKLDKNIINAPAVQLLRSGVLLGLRSTGEPSIGIANISRPTYRTIWISSKNKILNPARETKGLLVPRTNGFWKVELKSLYKDNFIKETLAAYPIETQNSRGTPDRQELKTEKLSTNILRNILFVGNDYISTEYGEGIESSNINFDRLQVVPIDKPENSNKIKISDIEGESGRSALINSAKAYLASNLNIKSTALEIEPREDNFAMTRRNGHWILKGRLDYLNPVSDIKYEDFTINLTPSDKIVNYDKLVVSWNTIKERVPEAIDAYTSPNTDIAIVISKDSIIIYSIENAKLSSKPIGKIKIMEGESVVMAEWATGDYVERWEKTMAQDSNILEY